MIPKIIHQTWKDNNIPIELKKYTNKVKNLNPNWEYTLWTDKTMLSFVENKFPDFLEIYNSFPKDIMRADTSRYLLMYEIGGVYLDLDYEVLQPFDFGKSKVILPYNRQIKFNDKYDGVGNCFFASVPKHKFWSDVIKSLRSYKDMYYDKEYILKSKTSDVEATTGPFFLSMVFKQNDYKDICSSDRMVYHPPTPMNEKERQKIINNGVSLGIHHCAGSWREKSMKQILIEKLKRKIKIWIKIFYPELR